MNILRVTMLVPQILLLFSLFGLFTSIVEAEIPDNHIPVIRKDVSKLTKFIIANFTEKNFIFCVLHCSENRFCAAVNYKEKAEGNEPNCQLTNTTEQEFDENASEKEKVWTFRKVTKDRAFLDCSGVVNECQNGGTVIWDPVKAFTCKCSKGSVGERCENVILKSEPQEFTDKLGVWLPKTGNWKTCWRAPRDGWDVNTTFHANCDGKIPTLTIVKVLKNDKDYIFGGYTNETWAGDWLISAAGSFLFSFRNNDNLPPFKAPLINQNDWAAIYRFIYYGPVFGRGADLFIANNANTNTNSYTNFGYTYQAPPGYSYNSTNTQSLLTGSEYFTPSEVEVFYLQA